MKNFKNNKGTLIGQIPEGLEFEKSKDYFGKYEKGDFAVLGYLKTKSEKYKTDCYSLYCDLKGVKKLLNVPSWYGSQLEEDFLAEGGDPETYFKDAYIETIEELDTNKGKSVSITIYED